MSGPGPAGWHSGTLYCYGGCGTRYVDFLSDVHLPTPLWNRIAVGAPFDEAQPNIEQEGRGGVLCPACILARLAALPERTVINMTINDTDARVAFRAGYAAHPADKGGWAFDIEGSTAGDRELDAWQAWQLTPYDFDLLRHTLGVNARNPNGYRNYFVAGGDDITRMERLRSHGLVVKNHRYSLSPDPCYHATEQGAYAIGLKKLPR